MSRTQSALLPRQRRKELARQQSQDGAVTAFRTHYGLSVGVPPPLKVIA